MSVTCMRSRYVRAVSLLPHSKTRTCAPHFALTPSLSLPVSFDGKSIANPNRVLYCTIRSISFFFFFVAGHQICAQIWMQCSSVCECRTENMNERKKVKLNGYRCCWKLIENEMTFKTAHAHLRTSTSVYRPKMLCAYPWTLTTFCAIRGMQQYAFHSFGDSDENVHDDQLRIVWFHLAIHAFAVENGKQKCCSSLAKEWSLILLVYLLTGSVPRAIPNAWVPNKRTNCIDMWMAKISEFKKTYLP